MLKLKTYELMGTPEQMGHAHGEELRDSIQKFVQVRLDAAATYFSDEGFKNGALIDGLRATGKACYDVFAQWDPEGVIEHNAIARAAQVEPADLYTITNYTDVRDAYMLAGHRPDAEGCTAVMVPAGNTVNNSMLAGQTWDLNPEDIDYVVAVKASPDKGPARWSVQLAGCLSLMGMNSAGVVLGTTNLKTWGSRAGVGYLNLIHRALRCNSVEEAAKMIAHAPKSGAHSYLLASTEQAIRFEVSGFRCEQQDISDKPMGWTNHCLSPALEAEEYSKPTSSSLMRFERVNRLLSEGEHDIASIKALFTDRVNGVNSINRYPEDHSYAATNACMIADPEKLELHACCGPADRGEWLVLKFD